MTIAFGRRSAEGRRRSPSRLAPVLAFLCGLAATGAAPAQEAGWPSRPIRILVPFAPGGVTDTIGRLSAEWLRGRLGQPAIVENRPGANGVLAVEGVARSAPDGYTLLTASASQMVMLPAMKKLSFDANADFEPISIVGSNPMVLAISAKLGAKTLPEFLDLARAQAGKLDYGTAGIGSSTHLAMALLLARSGAQMQAVPYRGGAPAMQALLAGDVAAYFGNPSDMIPHLENGLIRIVAIAGPERLQSLPGVPTVAESGFPGFRAETWNGLMAPAGTPRPVLERLSGLMGEACRNAEFRSTLEKVGTTPICSTPDQFRSVLAADAVLWREAVKLSGTQLE